MKLLLLSIVITLCTHNSLMAQSLEVAYLEKTTTVININNNSGNSQVSTTEKQMVLINSKGESIYKPSEYKKKEENVSVGVNSGMQIVMMGSDVKVYKNMNNKNLIAEEYIMDRKFLVTEQLIDFNWDITNEEQELMGYKCKKAVSGQTTVWYAPEIAVNDGPYIFWGLPGLIVKLEHQNKIVTATGINILATESEITPPNEGKEVSRAEYNEIMGKKMRAMGASKSQGTNVNIQILER